jgi:formate hydrogenlyase subunit 6/NADH:ubiquinone oxidoreductase subunit I
MPNPLNLPMMGRSLRNLVSKPSTRRYPYEIRPRFEGARGTLEFDVTTCNYCMLCARRCPAAAITVSREDRVWAIEQLTCIACGVCVDVCAKNSLSMSVTSRKVHTMSEVGPQGQRPGHEEWHTDAPAPAAPVAAAAKAEGSAS